MPTNPLVQALLARQTTPHDIELPNLSKQPDPRLGIDPSWIRDDGTRKGNGFLGLFPLPNGTVASEYSVGVPINGREMDIPSIVPTLSRDELLAVLHAASANQAPPQSVIEKAADFATQRIRAGRNPFAQAGEQLNLYPDIRRAK